MLSDSPPVAHRSKVALVGDVVRRFGTARVRVTGSSMLPALWPGDEVVVSRRSVGAVAVGDIAVFSRDHRLFVHRVTGRTDGALVTQGDAVPRPDAPVAESELLGVVVAVSRAGQPLTLPAALRGAHRLVAVLAGRSTRANRVLQRVHALRASNLESNNLNSI